MKLNYPKKSGGHNFFISNRLPSTDTQHLKLIPMQLVPSTQFSHSVLLCKAIFTGKMVDWQLSKKLIKTNSWGLERPVIRYSTVATLSTNVNTKFLHTIINRMLVVLHTIKHHVVTHGLLSNEPMCQLNSDAQWNI